MAEDRIKILCADDHWIIRDGIAALIANTTDMVLVGEASTGREAAEKFRLLQPDVTLMDLKMPGAGGIDAIAAICREFPEARLIVLTTYGGDVAAKRALAAGARAYLLKDAICKDLIQTIRDVHSGQTHVNPDVVRQMKAHALDDDLSPRELSVLTLIAAGKTNRNIGLELSLSEGTVKNHVKSIISKLQVEDRTQATLTGLERGIIGI